MKTRGVQRRGEDEEEDAHLLKDPRLRQTHLVPPRAITEAQRGRSVSNAISPKYCHGDKVPTICKHKENVD